MHRLARFFEVVTAVVLSAMVVVTFVDVVGRYLLNRPLRGAFELTEVLMAALIFAALPAITARREHIAVDILDRYFSPAAARVRHVLVEIGSAAVVASLAYIFLRQGRQMHADGLYTQALQLPLAPVMFFAMAAMAIAGLLHVVAVKRSR